MRRLVFVKQEFFGSAAESLLQFHIGADEFRDHGLVPEVAQANMAYNVAAGTTRGLHFQDESAPEAKFFRCIAGETFNVAVDARDKP